MKKIHVDASRPYDVVIGRDILKDTGKMAAPLVKGRRCMIVSDSHVAPLYMDTVAQALGKEGFETEKFVFPAGEESKCATVYVELLNALANCRLTRADALFALGGGVTGDLTGFAAATYLRGIAYIQLPTTVLAAVDSSVGGKTAIDLEAGKNLAGAFYQPAMVICDPDTLKTLPEQIYFDGCAEVIKYGFLGSRELLLKLDEKSIKEQEEDIIACCVQMKRDVVKEDEFDTGKRQLLNLGHTFAHGIEALSHYEISHGQAVAVGMDIVTKAAVKKGICPRECVTLLEKLLEKYHLPKETEFSPEDIYHKALSDKKRSGNQVTLIVPAELGKSVLWPLPVEEVLDWARTGMEKDR